MSTGEVKPLFGWLGPQAERAALESAARRGLVFTLPEAVDRGLVVAAVDPIARQPIWDLERKILGDLIPTGRQETGDCVSWGIKQAGERRQVIEIAMGQEEKYRPWFAPWIYAVSRNQVGGGMSGDGSTGTWGAEAIAKYGVLFADDEGVPRYSGALGDRWGHRRNATSSPEYAPFFELARDNPCVVVRVRSVEEAVQMVRDYRRPLTIASMRGFRMEPRQYKGYHVFEPSGTWPHQMSLIEYNDELPALYRLNSWGPDAHGRPLHGESPGGAWNLLEDLERELATRDVEIFALVEFSGEPGPPDHHPM